MDISPIRADYAFFDVQRRARIEQHAIGSGARAVNLEALQVDDIVRAGVVFDTCDARRQDACRAPPADDAHRLIDGDRTVNGETESVDLALPVFSRARLAEFGRAR